MEKLIIGISGMSRAGKDTIAKKLKEVFGLSFVCTCTDRPMRNYETNGKEHWFFTREEFDHLLETEETMFFTEIVNEEEKAKDPHYHGVRYVTRKKDLPDRAIWILDIHGIRELKESGIPCFTILVKASEEHRRKQALENGISEDVFEKRWKDEKEQFEDAEVMFDTILINDGTKEELYQKAVQKVQEYMERA